jgi:hypothetical protein
MNASRIRTGLAVGFLAVGLSSGTAVAQTGCAFSDCTPQRDNDRGGSRSTTTTTLPSRALPTSEERELPFTDEVTTTTAPELALTDEAPAAAAEGTLPFTGGDVAGMVVIGAAAVGIGAVMVRRSRTRTAE